MTNPWYVIHSKPRGEVEANQQLQRQGFDSLLPLAETVISRRRLSTIPYYPRYLFASFPMESLSKVRHTRGVARVVEFIPGSPLTVEGWIIDELRAMLDESGVMISTKRKQLAEQIQPGEPVIINLGAFLGKQGVFESRRGSVAYVRLSQNGVLSKFPIEYVGRLLPVN